MLEIKLEDVDRLYALSNELGVLTYLQSLVQYNADGDVVNDEGLTFAREASEGYLWEKQLEAITQLRAVLFKDGFIHRAKTPPADAAAEKDSALCGNEV